MLAPHGITIRNIADTLELSRAKHGRDIKGGHKLGVVCERELGIELDKTEQRLVGPPAEQAPEGLRGSGRRHTVALLIAQAYRLRRRVQLAQQGRRSPAPAA